MITEEKKAYKIYKAKIKRLYSEVESKGEFIEHLADVTGLSPYTIKNNWFTTFFIVPEKWRDIAETELEKWVENQ